MENGKGKKIAKRGTREVGKAANFDSYFDETYDDNVDRNDIKLPRIKIVQGSTGDKGNSKDGEFINTVNPSIGYGKPIKIIPIFHWKSQVMFDEKLNMIAQSLDHKVSNQGECKGKYCADCSFQKWEGTKPPACNEVFNFAIAFPEELDDVIKKRIMLPPLILSFMRTGVIAAKYILTNIRINVGRKIPIWANIIEIDTELKQFDVQPAYVPRVKVAGIINPKDKTKTDYLDKLHRSYKEMKLNVSFDDLGEDLKETEGSKKEKKVKTEAEKETPLKTETDEDEIPF